MNIATKIEFLRRVPLFKNLDDDKLKCLAETTRLETWKKNSLILSEDDSTNYDLFIIYKGKVQIRKNLRDVNGNISDNNKFIIIGLKKEGDYFGEMSLLDKKKRSAEVVTTTETDFLRVTRKKFTDIILNDEIAVKNLIKEILKHLRNTDKLLANLALMDSYQKVAMIISEISSMQKTNTIRYSRQKISQLLGVDPKYVGKWLQALEDTGFIIRHGYKEIQIIKEPFPLTKNELLNIRETVDV